MRELRQLIREIQNAVIFAADDVVKKSTSVIDTYFDRVSPDPGGKEGPSFLGNYTPKMVAFEYPVMKPESVKGPETHRVFVPLISIAPPATYYIDEVKVRLEIEMRIDDDGEESFVLVAPKGTTRAEQESGIAAAEGAPLQDLERPSFVEVVVRRGERAAGITQIVEGYDRALRAEIPG